jgi:hypothetical protein
VTSTSIITNARERRRRRRRNSFAEGVWKPQRTDAIESGPYITWGDKSNGKVRGLSTSHFFCGLPLEFFFEAEVARVANDEVIEQVDVEKFAGIDELIGDLYILR